MWLSYVLLCRDIELACDEKVIKDLGNEQRADYTQALVSCSVNRRMVAACPLAFGEVGVKVRVKSVTNYKKPSLWIVAASIVASVIVAVCFLTNPNRNEVLHLGLNAEVVDIDPDSHILYVKDIDKNALVFGDKCAVDCTNAIEHYNLLYVNYNAEDDVRTISFSDFRVGDDIIIGLYDSEKQYALNNRAVAKQIQLSTQRMNSPDYTLGADIPKF